jgi:hypothetical protein
MPCIKVITNNKIIFRIINNILMVKVVKCIVIVQSEVDKKCIPVTKIIPKYEEIFYS